MAERGRPRSPNLLTPRQQEVLDYIRQGLTNTEIGSRLGISVETVKQHVSEILSKFDVATREEAANLRLEEVQPWWRRALAPLSMAQIAAAAAAVAFLGALVILAIALFASSDNETDPANAEESGTPTTSARATPRATAAIPQTSEVPVAAPQDTDAPTPFLGFVSIANAELDEAFYVQSADGTLTRLDGLGSVEFRYADPGSLVASPNGRWIAFIGRRENSSLVTVYLKDLLSEAPVQILGSYFNAKLFGVFDDSVVGIYSQHVLGEEYFTDLIDPAQGTATTVDVPRAAWSPDRSRIAYFEEGALGSPPVALHLTAADGSSDVAVASVVAYVQPVWDPSGQRVAVMAIEGTYVVELDGTFQFYNDVLPNLYFNDVARWSPDGTRLVFTALSPEDARSIAVLDILSGATTTYPHTTPARWSPDSTQLVFAEAGQLKTITLQTGEVTTILDPVERFASEPFWLPNNTIVFSHGNRSAAILKIRPDATGEMTVANGYRPVWSPDSAHVAFLIYGGSLGSLAGTGRLWVVNADGSDSRALTTFEWSDAITCQSSGIMWEDNDTIVYTDVRGTLHRASLDGTVTTEKNCPPYVGSNPEEPTLSPDGQTVLFSAVVDGYRYIYTYPLGQPEASVYITAGSTPSWSPDGQWILFTR